MRRLKMGLVGVTASIMSFVGLATVATPAHAFIARVCITIPPNPASCIQV